MATRHPASPITFARIVLVAAFAPRTGLARSGAESGVTPRASVAADGTQATPAPGVLWALAAPALLPAIVGTPFSIRNRAARPH